MRQQHFARNDDHRDSAFLDRRAHRHREHVLRHLRVTDQFAEDAALLKEILRVGFLEVLRSDLTARDMRRDREHGYPAAVRVEQSVDQVQITGTTTAGAHREFTGDRGVTSCGEGGSFLVPDVLPRHAVVPADRVGEPVQRIARKTVDVGHATLGQGLHEVVCDGCHGEQYAPDQRPKRGGIS